MTHDPPPPDTPPVAAPPLLAAWVYHSPGHGRTPGPASQTGPAGPPLDEWVARRQECPAGARRLAVDIQVVGPGRAGPGRGGGGE